MVTSIDWRHTLGSNAVPGQFRINTGSLWTTEAAYFEWDPYVALAFWEQWFTKDRIVLRLGQQASAGVFDFFRFGDPSTKATYSGDLSTRLRLGDLIDLVSSVSDVGWRFCIYRLRMEYYCVKKSGHSYDFKLQQFYFGHKKRNTK